MLQKLRTLFLQSLHCEQGSVMVMMAASAILLVTATGAAIDMARVQTLQERMASALDAAGLAAGATVASAPTTLPSYCTSLGQSTWVGCQAQKYFNANFSSGYLGSGAVTVSATLSADLSTVSLSANTTQATTLMKVAGINSLVVATTSTVTRKTTGMELVLVLDNTGSMADAVNSSDSSVSKLSAVQTAISGTGGLLDILYGTGNQTANNLWMGVVPFTYMVNVGNSYTNWVDTSGSPDFGPVISGSTCPSYTGTSPATSGSYYSNPSRCIYSLSGNNIQTDFGLTSNWAGCMDSRSETTTSPTESSLTMEESDDPPLSSVSGTLFPPLYDNVNANISGSSPAYQCSGGSPFNCVTTTDTKSGCNWNGQNCTSNVYTTYNVYYPVTNSTDTTNNPMGPNTYCTLQTSVLPMTATRSNVDTEVGLMQAGGGTMINFGMVWAWRLLSPNWHENDTSGFAGWGGEMQSAVVTVPTSPAQTYNGLPLPYNTPLMNKVVILMTDGVNDVSGLSLSGTAYQGQTLPSNSTLDTRTLAVCTAMKNNGIIIYTIGFGTNDGGITPESGDSHCNTSSCSTYVNGALLQACASQPSYYFLAPTNAQLETAFQTVGAALSNLRVSQ